MKLTEAKIKNAKPQAKGHRLSDGDGMFLQIEKTGAKLWRLRYFMNGKENMHAMGTPQIKFAIKLLLNTFLRPGELRNSVWADIDWDIAYFCEDELDELHRRQNDINRELKIEVSKDALGSFYIQSRVGLQNLLMTFDKNGMGKPTDFYNQIVADLKQTKAAVLILDNVAQLAYASPTIRWGVPCGRTKTANSKSFEAPGAVMRLRYQ